MPCISPISVTDVSGVSWGITLGNRDMTNRHIRLDDLPKDEAMNWNTIWLQEMEEGSVACWEDTSAASAENVKAGATNVCSWNWNSDSCTKRYNPPPSSMNLLIGSSWTFNPAPGRAVHCSSTFPLYRRTLNSRISMGFWSSPTLQPGDALWSSDSMGAKLASAFGTLTTDCFISTSSSLLNPWWELDERAGSSTIPQELGRSVKWYWLSLSLSSRTPSLISSS